MTLENTRVAIIGAGNLGSALLAGMLDEEKIPAQNLSATRRHPERLSEYATQGVNVTADNAQAVGSSDVIILAVKPYNVIRILEEVQHKLRDGQVIVSVATGVSIDEISQLTPPGVEVYRAMPNTGADVGESLTCISGEGQKLELVTRLFKGIGETIHIDEQLMAAATVLGACGIAYVMRFIRAMVQGGIQIGFDSRTASAIVNQTVKGAASLLLEGGQHPEAEIDKVTTPRGCTIVGLNEMEHHGFSSSLIRGIVTSFEDIKS